MTSQRTARSGRADPYVELVECTSHPITDRSEQNDLISWLVEACPPNLRTVPLVTNRLLVVNFAAIHTSSIVRGPSVRLMSLAIHRRLSLRRHFQMRCTDWPRTPSGLSPCARRSNASLRLRAGRNSLSRRCVAWTASFARRSAYMLLACVRAH